MSLSSADRLNLPLTDRPRVVIVGGGFAGIRLAKALRKAPVQLVMLDKHNYHNFQPLLYQVATGGLEPDSIAFPLRKMFGRQDNFFYRMAVAENIEPEKGLIHTNYGPLSFDYLVLAMGSRTNYFGMKDVESNSLAMKTVPQALNLRSLLLQNFEEANQERDKKRRAALLNFVVVGGGPTGVETAGALAEIQRHILPNDYPEMDPAEMHVHLIEAGDSLLAAMSDKSSQAAEDVLTKMGVKLKLNCQVTGYDGHVVQTSDPKFSPISETVIWSAGITGAGIEGIHKDSIGRGARYKVNAFNQIQGHKNIFAIGDLALMFADQGYPIGHPQVSPVAIQQGELLGKNIIRQLDGKEMKAFTYWDKGAMATIGRNKAVVDMKKISLKGFVAWLAWMFVHIFYLAGFRNKLIVFINWFWSYMTYDKGTRLIIRPVTRKKKE